MRAKVNINGLVENKRRAARKHGQCVVLRSNNMKKYNFYSGPAILPQEVFEQAANAVRDFNGMGLSLIEISHRSKEFEAVLNEANALVKELFNLNDEWHVLWLQGGASMQFCQIPFNILDNGETAAFLETGVWSKKAIKEAKLFGNATIVGSSADKNFSYVPKEYTIPTNAKSFHITTNNTIEGCQIHKMPDSPVPLVGDMSSDIFSHVIDANKFDLIYAGAQKNIGTAGATLVLVKDKMLGKVNRQIPTMLDYRVHIKDNSLHNTPSVFAIYVSMLNLRWLKAQGGVKAMQKHNDDKAAKLYKEIDSNPLFKAVVEKEDRSKMNVCWTINKPELEEEFATYAKQNGCIGIKGHRSVGGFRASIYNAMPADGVDTLINVMKSFAEKHA